MLKLVVLILPEKSQDNFDFVFSLDKFMPPTQSETEASSSQVLNGSLHDSSQQDVKVFGGGSLCQLSLLNGLIQLTGNLFSEGRDPHSLSDISNSSQASGRERTFSSQRNFGNPPFSLLPSLWTYKFTLTHLLMIL